MILVSEDRQELASRPQTERTKTLAGKIKTQQSYQSFLSGELGMAI